MEPISWLSLASTVLSKGGAAASMPSGAESSATSITNSWFDGSGWTVATGQGSARGGDRSQSDTAAATAAAAAESILPFVLAAAVVALYVWKKA
jgi:hypothetical protein